MLLVTLLEFLLNLNSLPSDFSRPFFSPGCLREKELSAQFVHFVVECSLTLHIWSQQVYELIA